MDCNVPGTKVSGAATAARSTSLFACSLEVASEAAHEEQRDNCAHHRRVIAHYGHKTQNLRAWTTINHRGRLVLHPATFSFWSSNFNVFILSRQRALCKPCLSWETSFANIDRPKFGYVVSFGSSLDNRVSCLCTSYHTNCKVDLREYKILFAG